MKRREFLTASLLAAGYTAFSGNLESFAPAKPSVNGTDKLTKIKTAMMAFQRFSWEQGIASHAMLDSGDEHTVIALAIGAIERQITDGRFGRLGQENSVTDPMSCGEAVWFAWLKTGNIYFKTAFDKMLDYALKAAPKTDDGILYHFDNSKQIWVDSMYMAPPFLAFAGEHEEAFKQLSGFRKVLYDPQSGLYKHQYDDAKKQLKRDVIWATGNGWAAAGLARTLRFIPTEASDMRLTLRQWLRELIDAAMKYKTNDGYFRDIMDDSNSFKETNSGQMFAYAIYTAVHNKDLDRKYLKYANELRNAARLKVDDWGYAREAAAAPRFKTPGISTEAQAFAVMMESAYNKLKKTK